MAKQALLLLPFLVKHSMQFFFSSEMYFLFSEIASSSIFDYFNKIDCKEM